MPQFTYKGETKDGSAVTETVEAVDRFAVYDVARENGHSVTEVNEAGKGFSLSSINMEKINYFLSRVKTDELTIFTRNLSSMLTAGLPLSRAISVLERQSKNAKLLVITRSVRERINKGDQFFEALKHYPKVFSSLYVAMVRAGEESGGLAESLKVLSTQLAHASELQKKIKGAMIYPVIVIVIMLVIGILMMIYVMPTITATFTNLNIDLPLMTRVLIGTSEFLNERALLALLIMIGTIGGFIYGVRTKIGKKIVHYLIIRIPVIGTIAKETNAARTTRTLSSLLSSGVDVIDALKITEDVVQNIYYKRIISEAAESVEKGEPLSGVFIKHDNLYPPLVGEMVLVGEETGDISNMLTGVAEFYENEVALKTKDLSTIIEPLLMVVIGGAVGFFALAMIVPIYSISDSIG